MKYLLILITLVTVSCGSKQLKNDSSITNDADSRYESVLTSIGQSSNMGSSVYQFSNTEDVLNVYTLLSGTYEIRSDSCNFLESGSYSESEVVKIPLQAIFTENLEKLCTVTIQINPELKDSQVAIFPRYSIIYLQLTSRTLIDSKGMQFPIGFNAGSILNLGTVDKYKLIKNCVISSPVVIKESSISSIAKVDFDELNQREIGSCYYSLVYSKANEQGRYAFSINLFNPQHSPLIAKVEQTDKYVTVTSQDDVSVCVIGNKSKRSNTCKESLKNLPNKYLIQVHTNKRSYYEVRSK